MPGNARLPAIEPQFTILDLEKATPIMAEFVEATKKEAGCIYYGWEICGDKLFCKEAYESGEAVNATGHFQPYAPHVPYLPYPHPA